MMLILFSLLVLGGYFHYWFRADAALGQPWTPDTDARLFSQRPLPPPIPETSIATYSLPLSTKGRDIVDTHGRRFKLSSVNWYGASDELYIPGGLDVQHRSVIAHTIRKLGFNSVRMPYSDEMVMLNPHILPHLLSANPDLVGLRALEIFEACVKALTDEGIAVIINNHITSATWCCGADPCDAGWANDHLGPLCRVSQSEEDWIQHWETVRGVWGTMTWDRWATAAEKCGNRLLKMNDDWLIVVGGTESNNDIHGAATRPVKLDVENRLVYTAHVYAWSGWGSSEGRYAKRSYESFIQAMRRNWAYLVEDNTAPVWIGEFGAPHHPGLGDANYWNNLLRFLKVLDADFAYWAINPRKPHDNAKESYSLVEDDWVTPVLDYRMRDMTELIAGGKKKEDAPAEL
ncbi:family 5 glycoside hydrolase [Apiospora arundinis]